MNLDVKSCCRMWLMVAAFCGVASAQVGAEPVPETPTNKAQEIARRIEGDVARIRGLEFKSETKIGVYSKDELRKFLVENFNREMPPEKAARMVRLLTKLGLVAKEFDLRTAALELLNDQVAGFYDPERKELFLINIASDDTAGQKMNDIIMSHELVHALQDQHFDLAALMKDDSNSDRLAAIQSLVEGDATLAMMVVEQPELLDAAAAAALAMVPTTLKALKGMADLAKNAGAEDGGMLPGQDLDSMMKVPLILGEPMIFAYMGGMKFCHALATKGEPGGMASITRAFRHPPRSTEQIFHPEKYLKTPDWPTTVKLPDPAQVLGEGWSVIYGDVFGELNVRTYLNHHEVKRVARIHAGWDGDRAEAWGKSGEEDVLIWASIWDTESDAEEFAAALEVVLSGKGAPEKVDRDGYRFFQRIGSLARGVRVRENKVDLVIDATLDQMDRIMELLARETTYVEDKPQDRKE